VSMEERFSQLSANDKTAVRGANVSFPDINCLPLAQRDTTQASQQLVEYCSALYIYCRIDPTFLVPHAMACLPFIRHQQVRHHMPPLSHTLCLTLSHSLSLSCGQKSTTQHSELILSMTEILNAVIPQLESVDSVAVSSFHALLTELRKIIHNHASSKVVQSCVQCLCLVVTHVVHQVQYLQEILEYCCKSLEGELGVPETARFLVLIGLLCRYFDFDAQEGSTKKTNAVLPTKRVYSLLLQHASKSVSPTIDSVLRTRAIQGLGHLFIREPSFLRQSAALMSGFLQPTALPPIQAQALQCFIELLRDEEARTQAAEGTMSARLIGESE